MKNSNTTNTGADLTIDLIVKIDDHTKAIASIKERIEREKNLLELHEQELRECNAELDRHLQA